MVVLVGGLAWSLGDRPSGVGESDPDFPDKKKEEHKLLQMTCHFFFQQGEQGIWGHLQPAPAVTPAIWGAQGTQERGRGEILEHQTAGSSLTASPETPSTHTLHL